MNLKSAVGRSDGVFIWFYFYSDSPFDILSSIQSRRQGKSVLLFSRVSTNSFHKYSFDHPWQAEAFAKTLFQLGMTTLHQDSPKRPILTDSKYSLYLTLDEQLEFQNRASMPLEVFPEVVRQAVHWVHKHLMQKPYPYLKPWLQQATDVNQIPEGYCPRQLVRFETVLSCGPEQLVVRPNHGMVHLMRVTNYIAQVADLFKRYSSDKAILDIVTDPFKMNVLQIMMLFSVSGRVNEAGRAGAHSMSQVERELSSRNYEESRYYSAQNFKQYCEETGLVDVESDEFMTLNHAMLYMEQSRDRDHAWNPYIQLMSLTHSMDLMRCFTLESMKNIHKTFLRHFQNCPAYEANPMKAKADIFQVLGNVTRSQRVTGNRIMTGVDPVNQTYYAAKTPYDLDLFYRCTHDVEFAMNQLQALQQTFIKLDSTRVFPGIYNVNTQEDGTVRYAFDNPAKALLFSHRAYQERLVDKLLHISEASIDGRLYATVSVLHDVAERCDDYIHYSERSPLRTWLRYQNQLKRGVLSSERHWLKFAIENAHTGILHDLLENSCSVVMLLAKSEAYDPIVSAVQLGNQHICRILQVALLEKSPFHQRP